MRRRGFTLTELVVMMAILSILSTALYAVITLALTYYRNSLDRVTAENNARTAISVLTSEFRQAAHWGVESTSVILPAVTNDLTNPSHELEFQELVPNISLATLPPGAIDQDPSQFELIHYYLSPAVQPTVLLRTVAGYDVNGNALASGPPSVIIRSVNGGIDVSTVFWTSNSVTMVVTAQEGGYTDANQVYHPAVQDTITCNEVSASYHWGFALVLTLFAIALLAALSFTLMSLVTINSRAARVEYDSATAYYTARTGIAVAQQWISANAFSADVNALPPAMTPPNGVVHTWPAGQPAPSGGTFAVTVTSGPLEYPAFQQWWQIDVTGRYNTASRTLRALVRQESFARFAYFSQQEMNEDYWITGNSFQGPSHTNGHFSFWGTPAFNDRTTSANSDEMQDATHSGGGYPYVPGPPGDGIHATVPPQYNTSLIGGGDAGGTQTYTDTSLFYHALGGQYATTYPVPYQDPGTGIPSKNFTFAGGQPVINLPGDTANVIQLATPTKTYDGTKGDVTVTFTSTSGSGTMTVRQGTTVDILQTYGGPTYPVVAVNNGNVYVQGTLHGKCTVICNGSSPTNNSVNYGSYFQDLALCPDYPQQAPQISSSTSGLGTGNVAISDDLTYFDQSATSLDAMGLVANNNIVVATSPNPGNPDGTGNHTTTNPDTGETVDGVTVQATLMALHGIYMSNDWWQAQSGTASFRGQMFEKGGLIAQTQTLFGEFDPGSGQIVVGYNENYVYDSRLASNPPPAFPSTGNVVIVAVSIWGP